jgi:hypothetical protein
VVEGHDWTVPDLVFTASDKRGELTVAIEAKRVPEGHDVDQLWREAVDTAAATGASRLSLVLVGVDVSAPSELASWERTVQRQLTAHAFDVEVELRYSSWAELGECIEAVAATQPDLAIYAHDVLMQMELNGLRGYKGAPMADDLSVSSISDAFELVNRTIKQARQFFLTLTADSRFAELGLTPATGQKHAMLRDGGGARNLDRDEGWFLMSTFFGHYRRSAWPGGAGAFAAIYNVEGAAPALDAGAYWGDTITDIQYSFAWADFAAQDSFRSALRDADAPALTESARYKGTEWLYASSAWEPGRPKDDIDWTIEVISAAVGVWDEA